MTQFVRSTLALVAASLVWMGTGLVGEARAGHVNCGQTLVANTTFDADVGPCLQGLDIGADNIVVDLAGHTLAGTNQPELDEPGIDTNGHSGVVIRNGTVTGFSAGVAVNGGSGSTVTNMLVRDNVGSLVDEGDYGDGIVVFGSHANRITANRVIHNGTYDGIGILGGRNNVVEYNVVTDNNVAQETAEGHPFAMQDRGIWVLSPAPGQDSTDNVVRRNQVLRNGFHGIEVSQFAERNTLQSNSVARNGFSQIPGNPNGDGSGIEVEGNANVVVSNTATGNAGDGIAVVRSTIGPFLHGQRNTIRANSSSGNGGGPDPAPAFDLTDTNPGCDANVWSANRFVTFNQPCVTAP